MRQGAIFSQNTNMQPAFANAQKLEMIRKRIVGIYRTNVLPMTSGEKISETLSSPGVYHHFETPQHVQLARRVSDNRMRSSFIRSAAPAQVKWKNVYVQGQNRRAVIGPYNVQEKQSILYRISDAFAAVGKGGK